jgi:hypothetical protein
MVKARIYVAGAITPTGRHPHAGIEFITNIRHGIRSTVDVLQRGYAVFCPFIDYQYLLVLKDGEELTAEQFYQSSMAYLEVSDAVLVLPGWGKSKGTRAEIAKAEEYAIPVFYSIASLDAAFRPKADTEEGWFKDFCNWLQQKKPPLASLLRHACAAMREGSVVLYFPSRSFYLERALEDENHKTIEACVIEYFGRPTQTYILGM